jgi:proteasome accessory factor B
MSPASKGISNEERQLNLIQALLYTERPVRADELRATVHGYEDYDNDESFRRTFERDKAALLTMGVSLEVVGGAADGGIEGYRIDRKRYYLQMPELTDDELAALRLAVSLVQVGDGSNDEALRRVGGLLAPGDGPLAGAGGPGPVAVLPTPENLDLIFGAITDRATVRFGYRGSQRTVDPLRLDFLRGRWYVSADDHDRGHDLRCFRIDRIEGAVQVGAPGSFRRDAERVVPPPSEAWGFEVDEAVTAQLHVDATHADLVAHRLGGTANATTQKDGSVIFDVEVTNRDGFRWFVIDLVDHAEILGPPDLRQELISWLEGSQP